MSYIDINYNGLKLGLKFNEFAVRKYTEIVLQDLANGLNGEDIAATSVYAMIYGGLHGNSFVKRVAMPYTFEQVCDIVEVLTKQELQAVSDVFIEVQAYKDLLSKLSKNAAPVEKKKNQKAKQK